MIRLLTVVSVLALAACTDPRPEIACDDVTIKYLTHMEHEAQSNAENHLAAGEINQAYLQMGQALAFSSFLMFLCEKESGTTWGVDLDSAEPSEKKDG